MRNDLRYQTHVNDLQKVSKMPGIWQDLHGSLMESNRNKHRAPWRPPGGR